LFIKQKMTLIQVSTVFQDKPFDFNPSNFFERKNSRKLKIKQNLKNNRILNLIVLNLVFEYFKLYGLNDVMQVIQKTIKK
jgi:hypothetical protein